VRKKVKVVVQAAPCREVPVDNAVVSGPCGVGQLAAQIFNRAQRCAIARLRDEVPKTRVVEGETVTARVADDLAQRS
jgi:hypothetical protein